MGISKRDFKAIETMIRELPEPDYKDMCDFMGLSAPELRILDLKYRRRFEDRPTREYIAEELGYSPSTLDRRVKAIIKRIGKYANRMIQVLHWSNTD